MLKNRLLILVVMAAALLASACDSSSIAIESVLASSFEVDPVFREYYDMLGGENILGAPISPMFELENVRYQYTAATLMVNNPQAPENQLFHLAPLGLELGIREPPLYPPDVPHDNFIDGHWIHPIFWQFYNELGGVRIAGRPITEVHYNPERGRHEQHFENLGLYWSDKDLPGEIHLLSYGIHLCGNLCDTPDRYDGVVIIPPAVGEQFLETVSRLGADFTGFALTDVREDSEGHAEQVFEYLVLVSDPSQDGRVFARPIVEMLGFASMEGKGNYQAHPSFQDYIAQHGGVEIVGEPIADLTRIGDGIFRQCYANMCLVDERSISESVPVRPYPIGYDYKKRPVRDSIVDDPPVDFGQGGKQEEPSQKATEVSALVTASREIVMRVWESFSIIAPNQSQEIGVSVLENNIPLRGIQPYLTVTLPEGEDKTITMFPTGEDGVSRIFLDPLNRPNETLIPYKVCIFDNNFEQYCVKDEFMIWQNP